MLTQKSIRRTPVASKRSNKTRMNDKNRKVCARAMEFIRDKGQGPNPYCDRGYGQMLCKTFKSTLTNWYKDGGNYDHILGDAKDKNGRNWKWTLGEDSTDYYAVDCSGLTRVCYQEIGLTLFHQSDRQASDNAKYEVPLEQAQPGDLLYKSGHVAILGEDGVHVAEAQDSMSGCTYSRNISIFKLSIVFICYF